MSYKLFVQTSGRVARIVPESSHPTVAERVFGEISAEDALSNRDSLEDAVRDMLAIQGITDGDTYKIVLPDDLRPADQGAVFEDNKGPLAPIEKDHANPPVNETQLEKEPEKPATPPVPPVTPPKQADQTKKDEEKASEKTTEAKASEPKQEVKDETTKS